MCLIRMSVRRVKDIAEGMWGSKVTFISELSKEGYVHIEDWRTALCRAGVTRKSIWTEFICAVIEAVSLRM